MDENHPPREIPTHYLKVAAFYDNLVAFQEEYEGRLKLLGTAYAKIYEVLEKNNINPHIINNMEFETISEFEISFRITEKRYIFTANVRIKPKKLDPYVVVSLKNTKTGYVFEEAFHIFKEDYALSPQFMMYFRNNFSSYYNTRPE